MRNQCIQMDFMSLILNFSFFLECFDFCYNIKLRRLCSKLFEISSQSVAFDFYTDKLAHIQALFFKNPGTVFSSFFIFFICCFFFYLFNLLMILFHLFNWLNFFFHFIECSLSTPHLMHK